MSEQLIVNVVGGMILAALLAVAGYLWRRWRVPTILSHRVWRKPYLAKVAAESERGDLERLDALMPRLTPAGQDQTKQRIQAAWTDLNGRGGRVRVLTLGSDDCLAGGAELLRKRIEVRVARRGLGAESASYHVFTRNGRPSKVIANSRSHDHDEPVRIDSAALAQPFQSDFDRAWAEARPLEGVIADRILEPLSGTRSPERVRAKLTEVRQLLGLDPATTERVRSHLALRHSAAVIFLVGLPGAGKSHVRTHLEGYLRAQHIATRSHSDYTYAFRDFLHGLLRLDPPRGAGFEVAAGGAFAVAEERFLDPALQALAQAVRESVRTTEVTLVEFARADLLAALDTFDEIRENSQVIYVSAPEVLRIARLARRARQPITSVSELDIKLRLSNDHALPSGAQQALYKADNLGGLANSPHWRGRFFEFRNDIDDGGGRVKASLDRFVDNIVDRYRLTLEEAYQ